MIKNYLKIAWRNLINNKGLTLINIGGLAVGMTVAMLIGLWIWDELSFDKYHKNYESIVRVMQNQTASGEVNSLKAMPIPVAYELRHFYGNDFKHIVLSSWTNPHLISFQDKNISVQGNYMEQDAPEMLTLNMVKGVGNALKDLSSIILSESVSRAVFGDANPLDKILKLDGVSLKVAGVYQDLPSNTTFSNVAFIAPWELYANSGDVQQAKSNWHANSFQIFAQVAGSKNMAEISAKIKDIKLHNVDQNAKRANPQIFLFPMSRWHLYSEFKNGVNTDGSIKYVWLFGIIGVFVLMLAGINFMNLSTARSEKRAKEVGIRKSIGSLRGQLIWQFLSESLLVAILAFAAALLLVQLTLPFFNELTGKQISILWTNPLFWLAGTGFVAISGLFAGSYPAFYLSSFQPVKVLKGSFKAGRLASIPRKVLIVIQFTFSVTMIIGTIVVLRQIQFAKNRPIGYSRSGLIMVRPYSEDLHKNIEAIRNELLQTRSITEIAESGNQITKGSRSSGGFNWQGKDPNIAGEFATFAVSPEYGKTVSWQFNDGRDFSKSSPSDINGLILNQTAVKYMGLKNPVGQTISWDDKKYTVLGVTKDMIVESPYEAIKPTIFYINNGSGILNIRINPQISTSAALSSIEAVCKKYAPGDPFDYKFVDQEYAQKFGDEVRIGKLASFFAGLAIFISCLGLFGMASFMAEQRIKEIGVRKVLGATVFNLWGLLSKDFVVLVIISILISTPIAYYFMHNWLQNYTYHSNLSWWIFAVTSIGTIMITLLTVSYQGIKAALMNPVKSLKTE
jgi:putative ABC transport system permease protein